MRIAYWWVWVWKRIYEDWSNCSSYFLILDKWIHLIHSFFFRLRYIPRLQVQVFSISISAHLKKIDISDLTCHICLFESFNVHDRKQWIVWLYLEGSHSCECTIIWHVWEIVVPFSQMSLSFLKRACDFILWIYSHFILSCVLFINSIAMIRVRIHYISLKRY